MELGSGSGLGLGFGLGLGLRLGVRAEGQGWGEARTAAVELVAVVGAGGGAGRDAPLAQLGVQARQVRVQLELLQLVRGATRAAARRGVTHIERLRGQVVEQHDALVERHASQY